MQTTTHYSLTKAEGTDVVNLLTQCYPNFDTIDAGMFANKQAVVGVATEVTTGTVHTITRSNTDSNVFRFTATSAWTAGDTMTLDGVGVSVHLPDGTTPTTGAYIIGAEVLAIVNGSLVTLYLTSTIQTYVKTFNSRSGDVTPTAGDYDASMIDYDNTSSGLTSTDVQTALDEIVSNKSENIVSSTVSLGNVTIGSSGWNDVSSYKPTVAGKSLLFALIHGFGSASGCITVTSDGNYLMGAPGTTVTYLQVDYYFV